MWAIISEFAMLRFELEPVQDQSLQMFTIPVWMLSKEHWSEIFDTAGLYIKLIVQANMFCVDIIFLSVHYNGIDRNVQWNISCSLHNERLKFFGQD